MKNNNIIDLAIDLLFEHHFFVKEVSIICIVLLIVNLFYNLRYDFKANKIYDRRVKNLYLLMTIVYCFLPIMNIFVMMYLFVNMVGLIVTNGRVNNGCIKSIESIGRFLNSDLVSLFKK